MDWKTFWDRPNAVYVDEGHKAAHYELVAAEIILLVPHPDAVVLDHGCGEALFAPRIAASCAKLYLLDAAPSVRAGLVRNFGASPRIEVIAPEDLAALPDGSLGLVVANSVVQYLSADEFDACLALWRAKLAPDGLLCVADVMRTGASPLGDVFALLAFARERGFLGAALLGLARTAVSSYARLRTTVGLATYAEEEMLERLGAAGFRARRASRNLGHNQARMTFLALPA